MTGGSVVVPGLILSTCATTNSFQQSMNVNAPPATSPGPDTGSTALQYAWKRLQPSTSALLSRSAGTVSKYAFMIHTVNGSVNEQYATIRPVRVFCSPRARKI